MENNQAKLERLRLKRMQEQDNRDQDRLRAINGERLAAVIATALSTSLSLDDFSRDSKDAPALNWPIDIREASGLVAAYVSKAKAHKLLICFQSKLGTLGGRIGFHEKVYLGNAKLQGVSPVSLLLAAEASEDSIIFYNDMPRGVIMVDCYPNQPADPFSVVVQGSDLVDALTECFLP